RIRAAHPAQADTVGESAARAEGPAVAPRRRPDTLWPTRATARAAPARRNCGHRRAPAAPGARPHRGRSPCGRVAAALRVGRCRPVDGAAGGGWALSFFPPRRVSAAYRALARSALGRDDDTGDTGAS